MSGIGSRLRERWPELAWGVFALAMVGVTVVVPDWETVPFHLVWVTFSVLYGLRAWSRRPTALVLAAVTAATGVGLWSAVAQGRAAGDELAEVPLMAAMFAVMAWHAGRHRAAVEEARRLAENEHLLLERQRRFIRDASHELRTPITVARGHAELVRAATAGTASAEDAGVVLDELSRLERLSERLLLLATAAQPRLLSLAPIRADDFVASVVRRWARAAPRRWEVAVDAAGELLADADRLTLALDAILENAVDHTVEGGRIAVTARAEGGELVVEVADSGPGLPREQLDRIFEPFARTDRGRSRRAGGTGLGLAIARAVVQAHGGRISAESEPGAGATFRVRLPGLGPVPDERAGRPGLSTPTRPAGAGGT